MAENLGRTQEMTVGDQEVEMFYASAFPTPLGIDDPLRFAAREIAQAQDLGGRYRRGSRSSGYGYGRPQNGEVSAS